MTPDAARRVVAEAVAELARRPIEAVDLTRTAPEHGIDSLSLLVLRELIESRCGIHIPDAAWLDLDTLDAIATYAAAQPHPSVTTSRSDAQATTRPSAAGFDAHGRFRESFEVGMPMTGMHNLAENPLLKYLGHVRWTHLSQRCGVPSRDIRDADGHRLYPTFFYVALQFPESRHIATFGENERIEVVDSLERFGDSMLDGHVWLVPDDRQGVDLAGLASPADALDAGIAVGRLSCIFVKQFDGAAWLKKSRPAIAGFDRVPLGVAAPDSYERTKAAGQDGRFSSPPVALVPLTAGPVTVEHRLVPERDLNGAGLIYFANYPLFLDIGERQVLRQSRLPLSDAHLDKRSLVRRESAYLNNASATDTLLIEIEPFLMQPPKDPTVAEMDRPVRLRIDYRMRRRSDGRLMMVSSADKVITSFRWGDVPSGHSLASPDHG